MDKEEYDFHYVYSKLLIRNLDEKYLKQASISHNGNDLMLYRLNSDICDTHREEKNCKSYFMSNLPLEDSFYYNAFWLIEFKDGRRIKRPCVVLERYYGIRNGVKYSPNNGGVWIENLIYFNGKKLEQKIGAWGTLMDVWRADMTKNKWVDLKDIYINYHKIK